MAAQITPARIVLSNVTVLLLFKLANTFETPCHRSLGQHPIKTVKVCVFQSRISFQGSIIHGWPPKTDSGTEK